MMNTYLFLFELDSPTEGGDTHVLIKTVDYEKNEIRFKLGKYDGSDFFTRESCRAKIQFGIEGEVGIMTYEQQVEALKVSIYPEIGLNYNFG